MRDFTKPSVNSVSVSGILHSVQFKTGISSVTNIPWVQAFYTVRVNQGYLGRSNETSEITFSQFASKFKSPASGGGINKTYEPLLKSQNEWKTIQKDGIALADRIRFSSGNLIERNWLDRSGTPKSGWALKTSFVNKGGMDDEQYASFGVEGYIFKISEDESASGERLRLKVGTVQFNKDLHIVDMFVEGRDNVDYVNSHWAINQTVNIKGRVRSSTEVFTRTTEVAFGEDIPNNRTLYRKELVITTGDVLDDDLSFDEADMKQAFNMRKARIEKELQNQMDKQAAKIVKKEDEDDMDAEWA